ncbi:hypothetical protein BGX27_004650 [Mortierella sp. AM989]|nr:hypothetical protein BGX27_004650 [Mortierella sp. AM989]
MSLPQKSKSVKSHVQFRIENRDSDSDSDSDSIDLGDSTKAKEGEPDYYDPVYFDSDSDSDDNKEEEEEGPSVTSNKDVQVKKEDQDDDEMEYDIRAGISSSTTTTSSSSSMKDITMGLEKNSLESSKKTSKKNKKHPTLSDVDLLYDPDQDEKDQEWLMKKIADMNFIRISSEPCL